MRKLPMRSVDQLNLNIEKIARLFPHVIIESTDVHGRLTRAVDFDLLRQELAGALVEGEKERYQLTWPGKKAAVLLANTPIDKTLRPVKEDSLNWDKTGNLFLEGDNLDVLKMLQISYANKVKCIYIDPPYNTGKDFIYRDDFKKHKKNYLQETGQIDGAGFRLFQNNEFNGRFHSDWLSMIYPRLKLARNLLTADGSIFISIDDHEGDNLKKICDEIYGENNFIARVVVHSNPRGRQSSLNIAPTHEYVLIYAKEITKCSLKGIGLTADQMKEFNREDQQGRYREIGLRLRGGRATAAEAPTLHFPIYYNAAADEILLEKTGEDLIEIIPRFENGMLGTWRWSREKVMKDRASLLVRPVRGRDGEIKYDVFQKDYLTSEKSRKVKTLWDEKEINYDRGAEELRHIFGQKLFDYAKPVFMLKKIISIAADSDSIILDFFAGSATTAQAVKELNAEDGGSRRFIMVQVPEPLAKNSAAYKAGYRSISEISRERIRRAAQQILPAAPGLDGGMRVFRVDSSNMKDHYYRPEDLRQQDLWLLEANIKDDRSGEDLLFQVMLEYGLELSSIVEARASDTCKIYVVNRNELITCFDGQISEGLVRALAAEKPQRVVFGENALPTDQARLKMAEIFASVAPETEIRIV